MLLYFLIKSNFILAKRKIFQTHHIYVDEAKTNIYFKKLAKTEMEVNKKKRAYKQRGTCRDRQAMRSVIHTRYIYLYV